MKSYPPEMRLDPVEVAHVVEDGDTVPLEGFALQAIRVRGHSADSFAYSFEHAGKRCLISADIVFYGGVIGLINTADSNMNGYKEDLPKLAELAVDVLLPGHGLFTVSNGQIHIDAALKQIGNGFIPRAVGQGDLIF
jgi:glyoxylase-like metal-dependent hydrolase (beta-lactamase superfamily II)